MASSARDEDEAISSISALKIKGSKESKKSPKSKTKKEVLDSWEDQDELSSENEVEGTPPTREASPPAPSTSKFPQFSFPHGWSPDSEPMKSAPSGEVPETRRPEKTDAVARRMIAAGLGLRAPKQTEEQKAYQRSVREQEKRRKEQERAEEQRRRDEADKARAAIWDD